MDDFQYLITLTIIFLQYVSIIINIRLILTLFIPLGELLLMRGIN